MQLWSNPSSPGGTFAALTTILAAIGDRLGLFTDLAANGPATSVELATRTGIDECYAREWLAGMATSGYLEYDPASRQLTLPAEHSLPLAQEEGPVFFRGIYQVMTAFGGILDRLADAFRAGGGVPQSAYDDNMWVGLKQVTNGWGENLLIEQWIPAMPDVQAKLERGAQVADEVSTNPRCGRSAPRRVSAVCGGYRWKTRSIICTRSGHSRRARDIKPKYPSDGIQTTRCSGFQPRLMPGVRLIPSSRLRRLSRRPQAKGIVSRRYVLAHTRRDEVFGDQGKERE